MTGDLEFSCDEIRAIIDKLFSDLKESVPPEDITKTIIHTTFCPTCAKYLLEKYDNKKKAQE